MYAGDPIADLQATIENVRKITGAPRVRIFRGTDCPLTAEQILALPDVESCADHDAPWVEVRPSQGSN